MARSLKSRRNWESLRSGTAFPLKSDHDNHWNLLNLSFCQISRQNIRIWVWNLGKYGSEFRGWQVQSVARVAVKYYLPNRAECNSLARQSCTCIDSSRTLQTCADQVAKHFRSSKDTHAAAASIADFHLGHISEPSPAAVTRGSGNSLRGYPQNRPGSTYTENL